MKTEEQYKDLEKEIEKLVRQNDRLEDKLESLKTELAEKVDDVRNLTVQLEKAEKVIEEACHKLRWFK